MKKSNRLVGYLVLSFVFLFGSVGLLVATSFIDEQTQENTTEFIATIKDVEIVVTDKDLYLNIMCNEYGCCLNVSTLVSKNIDINSINDLRTGEIIYFSINNHFLDKLKTNTVVNIVSLRTYKQEVFSLSNYNAFVHDYVLYARVALFLIVIVLSIVIVVLSIKGRLGKIRGRFCD